tara:strand:+ start:8370 stop:8792 length:423 start_codon:yes stop_codon:yes gene_type:complete
MKHSIGRLKTTALILLVLPLVSLAGCTSESENWTRLDADEFETAIDEEADAFLLDTRTQDEWEADGHLENATLIPHDELSERNSELPDDKSTTILLYCRSGNRSQAAAETLLDLGYTDVRDLESGIMGWKDAGYSVIYGA